jgi:hypothetical protein
VRDDFGTLPLVAVRTRGARGPGNELRVTADGRFESRTGENPWTLIRRYAEEDLAELREEMARVEAADLPDVVEPAGVTADATQMTWRLRLADELREIVVREWREGAAPALERLYGKLFTIPRSAPATSRWRVRTAGAVVERTVVGEPSAVAALEPILGVLYDRDDALDPVEAGEPAELPAEPLLDVAYTADGQAGDRIAVADDGRVFLVEEGRTTAVTPLGTEDLERLRQAIETADLSALPDPVAG